MACIRARRARPFLRLRRRGRSTRSTESRSRRPISACGLVQTDFARKPLGTLPSPETGHHGESEFHARYADRADEADRTDRSVTEKVAPRHEPIEKGETALGSLMRP